MMLKQVHIPVAALAVALVIVGCGRRPQPVSAPPAPRTAAPADDSSAREAAERARLAAEEARRREETARARETLDDMIYFEFDSFALGTNARQTLNAKVPLLRQYANWRMRIVGHADERGSTEYNLALGMRRAEATREYLRTVGIDQSRLDASSLGEERPLDPGRTETAWARNRRAEFTLIESSTSP